MLGPGSTPGRAEEAHGGALLLIGRGGVALRHQHTKKQLPATELRHDEPSSGWRRIPAGHDLIVRVGFCVFVVVVVAWWAFYFIQ